VGVRDLEAARRLYADVLGLEPTGVLGFRAGPARIDLEQRALDGPAAIVLDAPARRDLDPAQAGGRISLER
jgi:catechol 2,3-dioxygenase-like lactoylglutathione lyase family enzyme